MRLRPGGRRCFPNPGRAKNDIMCGWPVNRSRRGNMRIPSDPALRASPARVVCSLSTNEPKNDCDRNRLPECCLLSGIWAWAGLFLFTPLNRSDAWLHVGAGAPVLWLVLWIAGALLGLIATALGSRRWILAVILALASFGAAALMMSTIQW
jgi:hypothetical protein